MSLVRLKDLTKTFADGTKALGPLDLEIRRGEFLAILGPSGCGKSTLLRLIAGLAPASAGDLSFEAAARCGFVFQEPTLMPWRKVAANVALPLDLQGRRDPGKVNDVLARVGLEGFADRYPRALSGGMRMRVSIARALVAEPDLLLMDEPFAALDEITRQDLNDDLLRAVGQQGCTTLFVTHSVFESVYLAQRIVVLSARPGRILADFKVQGPTLRDEAWRLSPDYAALARQVSHALRQGMGR